jgi:hypothetical protein
MSILRDFMQSEIGKSLALPAEKPAPTQKDHYADAAREQMIALGESFIDRLPMRRVLSGDERRASDERAAQAAKETAETKAAQEAAAEAQRQLDAQRPALEREVKAADSRAKIAAIYERMRVIAADRSARNKRELSENELRVRALRSLEK